MALLKSIVESMENHVQGLAEIAWCNRRQSIVQDAQHTQLAIKERDVYPANVHATASIALEPFSKEFWNGGQIK